jgi:hypothetical protein
LGVAKSRTPFSPFPFDFVDGMNARLKSARVVLHVDSSIEEAGMFVVAQY